MGYPGQRRHFGSKQPAKASQRVALVSMITNTRDIEKLPAITALANMYRVDAKDVEYLIGVERRRRAQ